MPSGCDGAALNVAAGELRFKSECYSVTWENIDTYNWHITSTALFSISLSNERFTSIFSDKLTVIYNEVYTFIDHRQRSF